ncbi:MAG: helix-turn-helix transcriptional regulator [Clostridia bacterium]|nr:helix-turn-helix transcriptional regulator [Clostridia bacterium]
MNTFSKKLRSLRAAVSLTQEEMAQRIGIPLRNYQNYETGKFYPKSTAVYAKIAKAFGITVDELIGETPDTEAKDATLTAKMKASELYEMAGGLFAGGELSEEDKDLVMKAISDAYWEAKLKKNN